MTGWFPRVLLVTASHAVRDLRHSARHLVSGASAGRDASQLGLIVASFSVISLGACLPLGRAIDRRGERPFLLSGSLLLIPPLVLLLVAPNLARLAVASAALGLAQLFVIVAARRSSPVGSDAERRDGRFATFTLLTSITMFAAPAVAGVLISPGTGDEAVQLRLAYVVGLVLAGGRCHGFVLAHPSPRRLGPPSTTLSRGRPRGSRRGVWHHAASGRRSSSASRCSPPLTCWSRSCLSSASCTTSRPPGGLSHCRPWARLRRRAAGPCQACCAASTDVRS